MTCTIFASPSVLTRHLRNVHFPSCRSVVLCVKNDEELLYNPLDIPDLIVSISECFFPGLVQFEIIFESEESLTWGFPIDGFTDPRFALAFDVLAPLLSFGRLTKLDLSYFCTSAIDDGSLRRMAQSWPQLEEFWFGVGSNGICWLVPPSVTFLGIIHLIQHCRHLRVIEIAFNASSIDTNNELFSKIIPNKGITSIGVGVSPIVDPLAVACQLHTLLPNLTRVDRFQLFGDTSTLPPLFQNVEDEWNRVNGFLEVLITGAKMKEKIGQGPQECQCSLLA
ncbi:hypothetical protein EDB19DRAFT_1662068 [Suillus lakei]|nr:hypothetical protein EDB19DRAFT_1662068 [Suillus lakei]